MNCFSSSPCSLSYSVVRLHPMPRRHYHGSNSAKPKPKDTRLGAAFAEGTPAHRRGWPGAAPGGAASSRPSRTSSRWRERTTSPVMLRPDPPTPPVRGRALRCGSCSPRWRRRGSDSAAPGWAGACWLSGDGAHGGSGVERRPRGFAGRRHVRLPGGGQAGERCPGPGGALNPLGGGMELPQGPRPLRAPALGWFLPRVPTGTCLVERPCREALAIPLSMLSPQRQAGSLKEAL